MVGVQQHRQNRAPRYPWAILKNVRALWRWFLAAGEVAGRTEDNAAEWW